MRAPDHDPELLQRERLGFLQVLVALAEDPLPIAGQRDGIVIWVRRHPQMLSRGDDRNSTTPLVYSDRIPYSRLDGGRPNQRRAHRVLARQARIDSGTTRRDGWRDAGRRRSVGERR